MQVVQTPSNKSISIASAREESIIYSPAILLQRFKSSKDLITAIDSLAFKDRIVGARLGYVKIELLKI